MPPWLKKVQAIWQQARALWPMRFPILILVIAIPFLILLPQAQDALLTMTQDLVSKKTGAPAINYWEDIVPYILFLGAWLAWAGSSFYWARFISRVSDEQNTLLSDVEVAAPYWLGAGVIIVVAIALIRANDWLPPLWPIWISIVGVWLVYHFLIRWLVGDAQAAARERDLNPTLTISPRLRQCLIGFILITFVAYLASTYVPIPNQYAGLFVLIDALAAVTLSFFVTAAAEGGLPRTTRIVLMSSFGVLTALFILSTQPLWAEWGLNEIPLQISNFLRSPVILMSAAAAWVFIGTVMLVYPGHATRLPITSTVFVLAVIFSTVGSYGNHALRQSHDTKGHWYEPPPPQPVAEAFADWRKVAEAEWGSRQGPMPVILVSTAGGASRAAYWTAKVLSSLEDANHNFHKFVFSISSVSGGSLGAVTYRALLNDLTSNAPCPDQKTKITPGNMYDHARDLVSRDFLSPTFLTGLYADLVQRFLPGSLLPDRARALEVAWEGGWNAAMSDVACTQNRFAGPFHALWPAPSASEWLPALLINGTSVKTGRRVITSNLAIDQRQFPDAIDFFDWTKKEIPVSTAIHNSARFPYIDAVGTIMKDDDQIDRIADGGYFENFGAATNVDLLETLHDIVARDGSDKKIVFVVLQISSDPEIADEPPAISCADKPDSLASKKDDPYKDLNTALSGTFEVASDGLAPIETIAYVRTGLGTRATLVTKRRVEAMCGYYLHFRLYNSNEPMSWALSRKAAALLEQEWKGGDGNCRNQNPQTAARLASILAGSTQPSQPQPPKDPTPPDPAWCQQNAPAAKP